MLPGDKFESSENLRKECGWGGAGPGGRGQEGTGGLRGISMRQSSKSCRRPPRSQSPPLFASFECFASRLLLNWRRDGSASTARRKHTRFRRCRHNDGIWRFIGNLARPGMSPPAQPWKLRRSFSYAGHASVVRRSSRAILQVRPPPPSLTCAAPGQGLLAWEQPRKFQKRKKFGCRERKRQGEPAARRCKPGRRARQSDVAFHSPTESSSTTPLALAAPNDSAATSSRLRAPSFPLAFAALRSRSSGSTSR